MSSFLDFWRYPMSFLQPPISNETTQETISSQLQKTAFPKQQDSSNSIKETTSYCKQISSPSSSFAYMHIKDQSHSIKQTAKEEGAAPLNDTLVGLQEVGDLLQASLKEIEHERVIANDSNESVTSSTSNANRENSIPIAISDRNCVQGIGKLFVLSIVVLCFFNAQIIREIVHILLSDNKLTTHELV